MKQIRVFNDGSEDAFHRCVFALHSERGAISDSVGTDTLPKNEVVRFKVPQHLGFPGKALEKIEASDSSSEPYIVWANFLGLTGPSGVMPKHYSEWIIDRCKQKDNAIKDFLDIFNHRLISLYHRAWEKYRLPLQYYNQLQTDNADPISRVLQNLIGTEDDLLIHLGGLFAHPLRSAQGVKQIVSILSGCDTVIVHEHIGKWLYLDTCEQTMLGGRFTPEGQYAQLGKTATLGKRVWDVGSAVEIEIFAPNIESVHRLMPGSPVLRLLENTIQEYLPVHMKVTWSLTARHSDMPVSRLGKHTLALGRGFALSKSRAQLNEKMKIIIA